MEIILNSKRIKYINQEKDKSEDITKIEIIKEDRINSFQKQMLKFMKTIQIKFLTKKHHI